MNERHTFKFSPEGLSAAVQMMVKSVRGWLDLTGASYLTGGACSLVSLRTSLEGRVESSSAGLEKSKSFPERKGTSQQMNDSSEKTPMHLPENANMHAKSSLKAVPTRDPGCRNESVNCQVNERRSIDIVVIQSFSASVESFTRVRVNVVFRVVGRSCESLITLSNALTSTRETLLPRGT